MSDRSGSRLRVNSRRGRGGPFDWLERLELYPQIAAGIAAGETNLAIAQALGISDQTVSRHRARYRRAAQEGS